MSDQSFEKRFGEWLRAVPGVWVHHPPDEPKTRQWKPGDFVYGHAGGFGVVECKEVQGATFPLSRWPANQRNHAAAVAAAGGRYWLVVHFAPLRVVAAFLGGVGSSGLGPGSLPPHAGTIVDRRSVDQLL